MVSTIVKKKNVKQDKGGIWRAGSRVKAVLKKRVRIGFNEEGAIEKRLRGGLEIRISEGEADRTKAKR